MIVPVIVKMTSLTGLAQITSPGIKCMRLCPGSRRADFLGGHCFRGRLLSPWASVKHERRFCWAACPLGGFI